MSAYRSSKRPPHIVFLVDTSPFLYTNNTLDDSSVTSLQAMILRILLYYVDMVDDRTTWGFRFFNTNSASITMSNRRFLPVSSQSIQDFLKELFIKVDQERAKPPTTNDTDSCYSNLKQTLMQTLAEFRWKDIDLLGASPRSQSIPNSTKSVTIKNYMYVVSHRPHTMDDLQHYMGESTAMVDKHRVLTCIQKIADDLKRWLWDDYANHQISINWIDREDTKTHKEVDLLIQTGFGSIMQMFGGHLITETMLKQDYAYWGLSFGTVFDHYRSLSMDATPELKLPILPDPKGKKLISNDKSNNSNNQIDTPIWSGPLISKTTNEDHLQVNAGSMKRLKSTQKPNRKHTRSTETAPTTTIFDGVESMEIVTFLYAVEIKREWLQHIGEDVHTLWSSNNDFSAIVSLLQERHMVLIVRLCLTANGGKLALVEPVFDGCASISLLPLTSEDEHTLLFVDKTQHMVDTFTPFGTNITDELGSQPTLLHESSNDVASVDIDLTIPPCINVLLEKASSRKKVPLLDKTTPKTCNKPTPVISTRVMPNTLDEFTKAIKDLYLDTLYTTKYSLLDSMTLLLSYIDHISSLAKQINFEMSSVVASLQSMIMLSSDFDDKHRVSIPEMTKSGSNKGSEQEVLCFSNWLAGVRTKYGRNTEHEELSFKALKIKDAKMQVIFLLTTIQTINQGKERTKATIGTKKKRRDYLPDIGQANLTSDNPEDQLEIYFDRIFIWEQVSNVVGFLQERDAEAAEQSTARLDPADIYIHQFCSHLEKCFVKKLPKLIGKLWEKVDKDDDKDDFDDVFPTPNKRRKTLLEMRMRGDSPGETMTANWIGDSQESTTFTKNRYHRQSSSSSQPSNQQHVESPSSGASKRKQSMFPILPFMKREIIMSKSVNTKPKPLPETTTTDTKPSFRRTGSFTKSATSPKRNYVKRKTTTETNTVVLRKRVPNSPTTPRTRLAREFGISMTPRTTSSSTNSSNNVDMPVTSSTSLMASLMATSPHRPKSTREFGIAVSPARSAARKIIGHKSPRAHRTGSARDSLYAGDEDTTSDGPRDLTNALMAAARHPTKTIYRAKPDIRKTFSSLFDD